MRNYSLHFYITARNILFPTVRNKTIFETIQVYVEVIEWYLFKMYQMYWQSPNDLNSSKL